MQDQQISGNTTDGVQVGLSSNITWLLIFLTFVLLSTRALFNGLVVIMLLSGTYLYFRYRYQFIDSHGLKLITIAFVGFWGAMLIAFIDSYNYDRSFRAVSAHLGFLFVGLFVVYACLNRQSSNKLFNAVTYLTLFWAVDALLQFVFGYDLVGNTVSQKSGSITGLFGGSERLGPMLAVLLPLALEWARLNLQNRKWSLVVPVVIVLAIVLTGSRTAWLIAFFAVLLYFVFLLLALGIKRALLFLLVSGVIFVAAAAISYSHTPVKRSIDATVSLIRSADSKQDPALQNKLGLWKFSYQLAANNWLTGVGPKAFRYPLLSCKEKRSPECTNIVTDKIPPADLHSHQMFLEIWAELGILGLITYLIIVFFILKTLIHSIRSQYYAPVPWLIAAFCAFNPFNINLELLSNEWSTVAWLVLLVGLAVYRRDPYLDEPV